MKVSINSSFLHAAAICAAKKDIRHYLNGINLVIARPEIGMIYGTDGHIFFAGQLPYENLGDEYPAVDIIIALDIIKKVRKTGFINLEFNNDTWIIDDIIFKPIDGKFPDVGRVIPTITDNQQTPAVFNPANLVRAEQALTLYFKPMKKDHLFSLHQRGDDSAVMHNESRVALVVVMPLYTRVNAPFRGFNRDFMYAPSPPQVVA